jgi:hypothetical protein
VVGSVTDAYRPDEDQEHARLAALFSLADEIIGNGFDVLVAAVWLKDDGTVGKSPLHPHGHLDAHSDRQLIRQQLISPPHVPKEKVPEQYEVVVAFVPGSGGCGVADCDIKRGAGGQEALRVLVADHGEFYKAVWNTPSGGANILWRKPPGEHYSNSSPWPGIDVRADGGWVVAPGNVTAAGQWRWKVGGFSTVAALPEAMVALLRPATEAGRPATSAQTVAFIEASPTESSVRAMQAFTLQLETFRRAVSGSRHGAMTSVVGWAFGMEHLDLRWALEKIRGVWLDLMAGEGRVDEVDEFARWCVAQERKKRGAQAPVGVDVATGEVRAPKNLPAEFWQRPLLADIRAWAHSRHRSADAVYACVRARFAATIPWTLRVDTGIATPVSLNSLTAIVADSGIGKSSAMAMAEEMVPITRTDIFVGPLGSGEGITEAYYAEVVVPNAQTGKMEKVKKRVRDGALFDLDEGEALARLGQRTGALLLPELRKAFSGRTLGQSNAASATRRSLAANTYRLVLLVGLQPEAALALLADAGTGTPQRFVLFNGGDPTILEDGSLPPVPLVLPPPPAAVTAVPHLMSVEAGVLAEVRAHDLAVQRGATKVSPLDSQRPANRLKEAAFLALLDGRHDEICAEDWQLAGMVMDTSDVVRSTVLERAAEAAERNNVVRGVAQGAREAVAETERERRLISVMSKRLVERVEQGPAEGIGKGELNRMLTSKATRHRFEAALDLAVRNLQVEVVETDGGERVRRRTP